MFDPHLFQQQRHKFIWKIDLLRFKLFELIWTNNNLISVTQLTIHVESVSERIKIQFSQNILLKRVIEI